MGMALRVVVPPHPLIGHWLTVMRDRQTPGPLFATAMAELGRWLTYEALRDWLPQRSVSLGEAHGTVVDPEVPLLAIVQLRAGLGLWQGAQQVLPTARVSHVAIVADATGVNWRFNSLPEQLEERLGVLVFSPEIRSGRSLIALLEHLEGRGVGGERLRVITALAAAPGLRAVGERFGSLNIHCACIDPDLDDGGQVRPGCGDPEQRLFSGPGAA
ncbi:MAG: uracil phosphoribosyltransferase [Cyanobacteriota bacterium]|nr:uracil phosphoribosyltransferase [Cyanobacteriota bacterium]